MHGKKTILILSGCLALTAQARDFSGPRAMEYARKAVSFGLAPIG